MAKPAARTRYAQPPRLKPLVAALIMASIMPVYANPYGGVVVHGSADISSSGNTLTVTNSPGAIINWQNFSIGSDEITRFVQQSASSTVLNRVTGADPSNILGALQSNGHVWLINPNGILFGQGARIDVAGLVASTLSISDQNFTDNVQKFSVSGGAGNIKNAGAITASDSVMLFAPDIENSGIITSSGGEVILAAGGTVELANTSNPALRVSITAGGNAVNLGQVVSQGGNISLLGTVVKQAGTVSATNAVSEGGRIFLVANQSVTLDAGSKTEADGISGGSINISADSLIQSGDLSASGSNGNGGDITLQSRFAGLSGNAVASGTRGGNIAVNADSITLTGNLSATGTTDAGGSINLVTTSGLQQTLSSRIDAGSQSGAGGNIRLSTSDTGTQYLSGESVANGGDAGGGIIVEGGDITLAGAHVSATGNMQGGSIQIGGGQHGDDASIQNAQTLRVNSSTELDASARNSGYGGKVILWSDNQTSFTGSVLATGGDQFGRGGFVEISSGNSLGYGGRIDVTSHGGKAGDVVFDPHDINIEYIAPEGYTTLSLPDPSPQSGDEHGSGGVYVLPNGNIVVASPYDSDAAINAGAVYLYKPDGTLISKLYGTQAYDYVGLGRISDSSTFGSVTSSYGGVTVLDNGNFVVSSLSWDNGSVIDAGAASWGSATTGVNGPVSASNSLVGSNDYDQVGSNGIWALSNGNYVVLSPYWNSYAGAATWGSGTTGVVGEVSSSNSLVGSSSYVGGSGGDFVGYYGITALTNGNYVVSSPYWNSNTGAATWADGSTGIVGFVSGSNSLIGSSAGDYVGSYGIYALANGNYVVASPNWNGYAGAATWGNGTSGTTGTISSANSLIGNTAYDEVGTNITALSNGNYVVGSPGWNNAFGAATWGNGATGVTGTISSVNSLVGTNASDQVGSSVTALSNGNYVVGSPYWNNYVGAVTWGNGVSGTTGTVSSANSLVGSTAYDEVGYGVTALSNGNYVVSSPLWNNFLGAATWGNGATGTTGVVSSANSLVGNTVYDEVGNHITPLSNGNYVVGSPYWDNGSVVDAGASTWGNGFTGTSGVVSSSNSLVGDHNYDYIGLFGVTALSNGNYIVSTPTWNSYTGAVTWVDGSTGISGTVSDANSLVGSAPGDYVGQFGITQLDSGNYVVLSPYWQSGTGAVTWGSGTTGVSGIVSDVNSLVGSAAGDYVGISGVTQLINGNYVVSSPYWNGSMGAATWGSGTSGVTGMVSDSNSLVGNTSGDYIGGFGSGIATLSNGNYVVAGQQSVTWGNGTTGTTGVVSSANSLVVDPTIASVSFIQPYQGDQFLVRLSTVDGSGDVELVSHSSGNIGTLTGSVFGNDPGVDYYLDPSAITALLDAGANVTLQADNDINVNADIVASPSTAVSLTMQANNDINLNANIGSTGAALDLTLQSDADKNGSGAVYINGTGDPNARVVSLAGGMFEVLGQLNVLHDLSGPGSHLSVNGGFYQDSTRSISNFDYITIDQFDGDLTVGNLFTNIPVGGYQSSSPDGAIALAAENGNVSQYSGTQLGGSAVAALASGSVMLTENNPTGIIMGAAGADFSYSSSSPIKVTYYDDGMHSVFGITAGSSVVLKSDGDVVLDEQIVSGFGDIAVSAAGNFVNNYGSDVLSSANGRWLVYANDPSTSIYNGLDSGNQAIWGQTYSSYAPADVSQTGNRYIFAWRPTVTFTGNTFSKTYGDDLSSSIANAYGVSGIVSGISGAFLADTAADAYSGAPSVASLGAAAGAAVAGGVPYTVTVSGGDASGLNGYQLAFADGALTINKADATVIANSFATTYNGLTQSASGFTATGLVNGETTAVLTGVSESGGTGKNAGSYAHTLSGTDGNYNLSFVNGSLDIAKANATVTANSGSSTYNGLTQFISGFTASGLVNGENETVLTGVTAGGSGKNAGTYTTMASGSDGNYNLSFVNGSFVINKANAIVTANSGSTTYNGQVQSISGFTASGLVNGETEAVLTTVYAGGSGKNAGTYITKASGSASNYNLSFVDGAFVINKANAIVTANSGSATYTGLAQSISGFTASGLVNGETEAVLTYVYAGGSGKNAGTYTTKASGFDDNYNLSFVDGSFVINKADATVIANSLSTTYNGLTQSASGFTATGLVNGETTAVLTGVSESGGTGKNAGSYAHMLSGTDGNYNLSFVNGSLDIAKANATVIANSGSSTYNGLTQSISGFTASGLVNGENETVLTGVTAGGSGKNAGTYTTMASGSDGNYNLSFINGSFVINKANATVIANSLSTTYNGQTQSTSGFTATGLVNGETTAVLTGVSESGGTGKNAGSYAHTLSGTDGNYNLSFVNGSLDIAKARLTISAATDSRMFDDTTNSSGAPLVAGLVGNDFTSGLGQSFDSRLVGTRTLSVTAYTVNDGNGGNNYEVFLQNASGSILVDPTKFVWAASTAGDWETATNWNEGVAPVSGSTVSIPGMFSGAGIKINSDASLAALNSSSNVTLANGSLKLGTGLGETSTFSNGAQLFITNGSLILNSANLISNVSMSGGALRGNGSITGDVSAFAGTIDPGFSPGVLNFVGNLTLGSSTLLMQLGDPNNSAANDKINVTGNLTEGGSLVLTTVNGYEPANGDSFELFTYGSQSGSFDSILLNGSTVALTGGELTVAPVDTTSTTISQVLVVSETQVGTSSGQTFTVTPVNNGDDEGQDKDKEKDKNKATHLVCTSSS